MASSSTQNSAAPILRVTTFSRISKVTPAASSAASVISIRAQKAEIRSSITPPMQTGHWHSPAPRKSLSRRYCAVSWAALRSASSVAGALASQIVFHFATASAKNEASTTL